MSSKNQQRKDHQATIHSSLSEADQEHLFVLMFQTAELQKVLTTICEHGYDYVDPKKGHSQRVLLERALGGIQCGERLLSLASTVNPLQVQRYSYVIAGFNYNFFHNPPTDRKGVTDD